ncbi:MAG: mannose-1-phosphate guanylyltransferase [Flavobacteriales bacterium]|nr:mannose-1-phosphate guanylyltransferase [Flavobacteriales bacterium]
MAGGVGSRFWPMSRTAFPKQFHDILGVGQTLIQMTFNRFLHVCPPENIYVVTNARYKDLVLKQLPQMKEEQVLCEPYMRNTAPCIAYANAVISKKNKDARIVVAPSDHLVLKEDDFVTTINLALDVASETPNLVTLGIKPSRPDTGYGYIQFIDDPSANHDQVKKVKTFTEKPDIEIARNFLASGDFAWNSGIFIWSLKCIDEAFAKFLPEIYKSFEGTIPSLGTPEEHDVIDEVYASCENISIDYGIMEKARNVSVVLSDFGWSDLGTWGSLYTHLDLDEHKNAAVGKDISMYNCANNMVYNQSGKLMVLHGLNGYIVVETDKALLVCKKDDEQKIKQFVNDIKIEKGEEHV